MLHDALQGGWKPRICCRDYFCLHFSRAPCVYLRPDERGKALPADAASYFNSGLVVLRPSRAVFAHMQALNPNPNPHPNPDPNPNPNPNLNPHHSPFTLTLTTCRRRSQRPT